MPLQRFKCFKCDILYSSIRYFVSGKQLAIADLICECAYITQSGDSFCSQIQLGVAILNLKECDFIVYSFSENIFVIKVNIDEEFVKELVSKFKNVVCFKNVTCNMWAQNVNKGTYSLCRECFPLIAYQRYVNICEYDGYWHSSVSVW